MHWTFVWLGYLLTLAVIPHVLLRNKPPVSTLAWIWAVILFPYIGPLFYFIFADDRVTRKKLEANAEMASAGTRAERRITPQTQRLVDELPAKEKREVESLSRINGLAISSAEETRLLIGGAEFFAALADRIREAKHHVHIEFFIWRDDPRGREMRDHLTAAARRGIQVRVLLDQLGCFGLTRSFFREYEEAGGQFSWFRTAHPFRNRWTFNLRNHRKLQIIDGRHAFIGGMNMASEYAGEDPKIGPWQDVQLEVTGAAAKKLQMVFADDWFFAVEEKLLDPVYYPQPTNPQCVLVQPMPDGPDTSEDPIQMSLVAMLHAARHRVWLTAGYFVPNEPLLTSLKYAAARGTDVRLLISEKSDHPALVNVGRSYYEELLGYGVKVYEYERGINHAKVALIDDDWLMVGSANFDIRSMRLNFELNVLVRDPARAAELEKVLLQDFDQDSNQISLEEFRKRPFSQRFKESLTRPLAPLL
ncbi:MAG TPA: cardiolipin synthase [Chthoniobacteraceae bacterium]|jgi:cardiolipin synthase|nr:Phospholipase D/Transphosphatidylase [Chthoniobacter sp.]HEV7868163.1 cardiolipin synthase [Chthoniobacteraceae bacterium]